MGAGLGRSAREVRKRERGGEIGRGSLLGTIRRRRGGYGCHKRVPGRLEAARDLFVVEFGSDGGRMGLFGALMLVPNIGWSGRCIGSRRASAEGGEEALERHGVGTVNDVGCDNMERKTSGPVVF